MTFADDELELRARRARKLGHQFPFSGAEAFNYAARKPEPSKCTCGQPVAVLRKGTPCVQCKSCIAKRLVGDLDSL